MSKAIELGLATQIQAHDAVKSPLAGRVLALGEILWDVFDQSRRLGGAPLNFADIAASVQQGRPLLGWSTWVSAPGYKHSDDPAIVVQSPAAQQAWG